MSAANGKRIADDGSAYTKEEFIGHYGGLDEWLAAERFRVVSAAAGKDDDWFYTDDGDEALLHGPCSIADLQSWAKDGHFALTDLVRRGRSGAPVELSLVLHAASM